MPKFGDPPQPQARLAASADSRPDASEQIGAACRLAVAGKLAMREIAVWACDFALGESEFRVLWLLFQHQHGRARQSQALDQTELAERLAVSAAQLSGLVERLRKREMLDRVLDGGDRRRQLWRLAPAGEALVLAVVASVAASEVPPLAPPFEGGGSQGVAA